MDSHLDSDSYWNRSTSKAFSFDDDDDSVLDTVSKSEIPGIRGTQDTGSILNDDTISEASFDSSATAGALNLSIKSVISEECLQQILQEQTLDDNIMPKNVTLEEELRLLRRQIQTTLYHPSAKVTAHKLLLGKNCSLEIFKSLQEKQQLLDAALENGAGDGIIAVVLFLKKTLNRVNFYKILKQRPEALDHYISYLTQCQSAELYDLLQYFGRPHDMILQQFEALQRHTSSSKSQELEYKQQKLRLLLTQYTTGSNPTISIYQNLFENTLKLYDFIAKERNALDNLIDVDSTPIEVLYACCRKYSNWKEQDMSKSISPFRLSSEQQISAAQFEWTALNERASIQAYGDLECIFVRVPTWNPLKQKQFHISFNIETAIFRLFEMNAPAPVLYFFISKISDADDKLEISKKVKCIKGTIDALVSLKDVAQLTQLKESLPERSEEQFYCEKALKSLLTKRWPTDGIKTIF